MTRYELRLDAIAASARRGDARPEDVLWLLSLLPPALGVSSKSGSLASAPERGGSLTYCDCPYCEQPHMERT